MFGIKRTTRLEHPVPGAEDFSYVLREVPGAFIFLGACPAGTDLDAAPSNHSARALFDDEVIADGMTLLSELALRRLATEGQQRS